MRISDRQFNLNDVVRIYRAELTYFRSLFTIKKIKELATLVYEDGIVHLRDELTPVFISAEQLYISWTKIEFKNVYTTYLRYKEAGLQYSIINQFARLKNYVKISEDVELPTRVYVKWQNKHNVKYTRDNAYLSGLRLEVSQPIFVYTPVNLPLFFRIIWYKLFKSLIIALFVTLIFLWLLVNFFYINLLKQLAIWAIIGLLFFWLMSGFNFFLKRYRFGKFTSAILRFWKRTNSIFWFIEGFLFSIFFYYYLNSSQEPLYFYDTSNLNQDLLISLSSTYYSYLLLVFLIWYSYYIMLKLPQFIFKQTLAHLTIITVLFIYIYLLESYQMYYTLTIFYESIWTFDVETNLWNLETESPRLRAKQQYLILLLIAKYWHFVFIFISWLFFIFKSFEEKRAHYTLFGVNLQNLIFLFVLNLLFIAQWGKWWLRRYYDCVYYWFFTDSNMFSIKFCIDEFFLLLKYGLLNMCSQIYPYTILYISSVFTPNALM